VKQLTRSVKWKQRREMGPARTDRERSQDEGHGGGTGQKARGELEVETVGIRNDTTERGGGTVEETMDLRWK